MEAVVENSLEATNYLVDKHFDKGWDRYRKYVNGRQVENKTTTFDGTRDREPASQSSSFDSSGPASDRRRLAERPPGTSAVRSSAEFSGGAPLTGSVPPAAAAGAAALGATTVSAPYPASRRQQRNTLPSPDRDDTYSTRRESIRSLQQESHISDRVLRDYELEVDDPKRAPESVLSSKDLRYLKEDPRRDSGMSGYNDNYAQSTYTGERPRSQQPPKSRYYDDDADSDYDERSGRRYRGGNGRGYDDDDRDYDHVIEETERYRGPPANRPWGQERRESYRSGYDGPYGAGAVTQYGRRSDGALDRTESSYVSRRTRGRDRERSYSRSPSGSRSRSRSRGGGIKEKVEDQFDLSARGLGVGVAGAVIGGLAGREFGQKHRQRDIAIGALIGGLGANFAENKWKEWKDNKERDLREDEDRFEQRYEGRDYGRSRSNVR